MITLKLPWPPSANRYWRHARGRTYLSKAAKAFRANVLALVWDELGKIEPLTGDLGVVLRLTPPDCRSDVDNSQKPALDALEYAGVYANDNQVSEMHTFRGDPEPPGAILVEVWQIDAWLPEAEKHHHPLVDLLGFVELLRNADKVVGSQAHDDYARPARESMIGAAGALSRTAARMELDLIAGRYSPLADPP